MVEEALDFLEQDSPGWGPKCADLRSIPFYHPRKGPQTLTEREKAASPGSRSCRLSTTPWAASRSIQKADAVHASLLKPTTGPEFYNQESDSDHFWLVGLDGEPLKAGLINARSCPSPMKSTLP